MTKTGFNRDLYVDSQAAAILERARKFDSKLYIEFGGKLLFDYHASRVLPGYDPNTKIELLRRLGDKVEILLCVHAGDIERRKVRADFGITYDADAMKLFDDLTERGLDVRAVVLTRFRDQPSARTFVNRLQRRGIRVYTHATTAGYPTDVDLIVSPNGYGANPFIETRKPIVVVTGPGPGSGKMATCLSQIYHESLRGVTAGYAKFETFPVWNLPLKHPVNLAYEAATADVGDFNQVDPFHLEAYGKRSVNYNRDIEIFPVVERILRRILGGNGVYRSPTDMGVNQVGFCLENEEAVRQAAIQEVVRRYFRERCGFTLGIAESRSVERVSLLLEEIGALPVARRVVEPARAAARRTDGNNRGDDGICCGAAIQLPDGTVVSGRNSPLLHAASSMLLNAIKQLSGIPDKLHLLAPNIISSISKLKGDMLREKHLSLNVDETLIALSISATANPAAQLAMDQLPNLRGCEVHLTHIPPPGDEVGLKKIGLNATSDPHFPSKALYQD